MDSYSSQRIFILAHNTGLAMSTDEVSCRSDGFKYVLEKTVSQSMMLLRIFSFPMQVKPKRTDYLFDFLFFNMMKGYNQKSFLYCRYSLLRSADLHVSPK